MTKVIYRYEFLEPTHPFVYDCNARQGIGHNKETCQLSMYFPKKGEHSQSSPIPQSHNMHSQLQCTFSILKR